MTAQDDVYDWAADPDSNESHYDVPLDPDEDDVARHDQVYVDATVREHQEVPIVPANWRGWSNIKRTVRAGLVYYGHVVAVHAVRSPRYAALLVFWAVVGAGKVTYRFVRWVGDPEGRPARDEVTGESLDAWRRAREDHHAHVKHRLVGLAVGMVALAIAGAMLWWLAPWWVQALVVLGGMPALAAYGKPRHRHIVTPAVVTPRVRRLNSDIVLRAYWSAGLGHPDKPGQQITFGSPMARDGDGSAVAVDLPYGKGFSDAIGKRGAIASGLDVSVSQVYLTRDPTSNRRHRLWVADRDPLAVPAGRTPLLRLQPADIWTPAPFGVDERGRKVELPMVWNSILVGAQPRQGKALALDTPVPTPSGWSTMGELSTGDEVYDEQGNRCHVVEAWPARHDRPCYEVRFSDGSVIVADAEHLWQVESRSSRLGAQQRTERRGPASPLARDQSGRWALPKVVTTAEMLDSVRIQADQRANYSVRVAAPLSGDEAEILVPPYTLGAWLGDGTGIRGEITTPDPEVIAEIEAEGEVVILHRSTVGAGCPGYGVHDLTRRLRLLGVRGDKHIPVAYLRASKAQRRALLAGLLDTDGYCTPVGGVIFAVSNERLARDVLHLVATLGYKPVLNCKPARLEGRDYGWQWIVSFTPPDKVFRLPRKAGRQVTKVKASAGHRFIVDIRPVPSVPVRCITVDSPNSLYLVGETCIPTHNSFSARALALFAALDPYVKLTVFDAKGSPDWRAFAKVADRYGFGLAMTRDGDPAELLLDTLAAIKADVMDRYQRLSALPTAMAPEGKLTRAIARDPQQRMPVHLVVLDEFQEYFDLGEASKDIASLLVHLVKVAPGAGVILLCATQRPSGIGSGQVGQQFTSFRDNFQVRFSLRTGSWQMSDLVLGAGAYSEGYDSSALLPTYKGVGILRGHADETPTTRVFLADGQDADKILTTARRFREAAGTLSGMAAGDETTRETRDPLADTIRVFAHMGRPALHWSTLAEELAKLAPQRYAGEDQDSVSALLRGLGVPSQDVKVAGKTLKGCRRDMVEEAVNRRGVAGSGTLVPATRLVDGSTEAA